MEDKRIIELFKSGFVEQATTELIDSYGSRVFASCIRVVGNVHDAQELTNDVFFTIARTINRFEGRSSLSTWIYRLTYNAAISHQRRAKGVKQIATQSFNSIEFENTLLHSSGLNDEDSDFEDEKKVMFERINRAIKTLSPKDEMLINLYYFEQLPIDEIARCVDISISSIKVRLMRIRNKISKFVEDEK